MGYLNNLLLTLYSTAVIVKINLHYIAEETKKNAILTELTKIIERGRTGSQKIFPSQCKNLSLYSLRL